MKKIFTLLMLSYCVIYFRCKKSSGNPNSSGSGNQQNSLQTQLQGKWNVVDRIAINLPDNLPNDTTIPTHAEYLIFNEDSVISDSWYTASLAFISNPPTFTVTQTTEFNDTVKYSAGANYVIGYYTSVADTFHINKISSTQLVLQENFPAFEYDIITELSK